MAGSRSGRAAVLAYHAIADLGEDPVLARYSVPPRRFVAQIDGLLRHGWTFVDVDALLGALDGSRDLPPRSLLLTFDDAYVDLLEVALPVLVERDIPAVVFAVAGRLGGTNEWDSRERATTLGLLGPDGLQALAAKGVEVGSHTTTHRRLDEVPAGELENELAGAADRLEAAGLPRPRTFSYPYGAWSPALAAAVREARYRIAFTVDWGEVVAGADPYALPRVEVHAGDGPRGLRLKLAAAGRPAPVQEAVRRTMSALSAPGALRARRLGRAAQSP
jgi:peptidoglycan/xylan/chitin deacetylase (PgdA/CDA1 family)